MKAPILRFIFFIVFTQTVITEWSESNYSPTHLNQMPGYGDSWIYMPNEEGQPTVAYLKNNVEYDQTVGNPRLSRDVHKDVTFDLYTRKNPTKSQEIKIGDVSILQSSNIDLSRETKIITHGWMSSNKSKTCQQIKDKYLKVKQCNVIIVDWAPIAKNIFYFIPVMDTSRVGTHIARLIEFFVDNGAKLDNIHLIGHSLGAHVCGFAGARVSYGKIGRITGLDPALPGYELIASNSGKLDASDAQFVDIIHTCGGTLGYYSDIGDADFYPNGGTPSQPGCFGFMQMIESCSHGRSWEYFVESIGNPNAFPSVYCDSWKKFSTGQCNNEKPIPMGEETVLTAKGKYYLRTSHRHPFHAI